MKRPKNSKSLQFSKPFCYDNDMDSPKEETISDILRKKMFITLCFSYSKSELEVCYGYSLRKYLNLVNTQTEYKNSKKHTKRQNN